jgi:hypothetical protein
MSRMLLARIRSHEALGELDEALRLSVLLRENDPTAGWQRVPEVRLLALRGEHAQLHRRLAEAMSLPSSTLGWERYDAGNMLYQVAVVSRFRGDSALTDSLLHMANEWYRTVSVASPGDAFVRRGHARVLYATGNDSAANRLFADLAASADATPEDVGMQGVIAFRHGQRDVTDRILRSLESDSARYRFGQQRAWAARLAALTGQSERAVQLLYAARREGFTRIRDIIWDPSVVSLRQHAGYREFMAPLHVTARSRD